MGFPWMAHRVVESRTPIKQIERLNLRANGNGERGQTHEIYKYLIFKLKPRALTGDAHRKTSCTIVVESIDLKFFMVKLTWLGRTRSEAIRLDHVSLAAKL